MESFAQMLAQMGVPEPQVAAVLAGLAEFGGGLGLALGLGTPPAGLVASANMAVAARKAHWPRGFYGQGGYEFPLLLGLVAAVWRLPDLEPSRSTGSSVETEETGSSPPGLRLLPNQRTTVLPVTPIARTLRRVDLIEHDLIQKRGVEAR